MHADGFLFAKGAVLCYYSYGLPPVLPSHGMAINRMFWAAASFFTATARHETGVIHRRRMAFLFVRNLYTAGETEPSMDFKDEFTLNFTKYIKREGAGPLLEWIKGTDFFTAPASTRFHNACECGLVKHSLNVFNALTERYADDPGENMESLCICGLLHDLCKAEFYRVSYRNVKNDATGEWERLPYYTISDRFPYGHGEKSVYLIERFMRLKPSEAMAIRWHMGGFDDAVRGGSYSIGDAFEQYPLAVKLHVADIEASYLREAKPE